MKKRILSLVLAVLLTAALLPIQSIAEAAAAYSPAPRAEAPRVENGRERRRFRRRENCSFPLKPAVDWFRMVLSKKRKGDIAYD